MTELTKPTEETAQQRFEQKVRDRLREDIGELLPDDVLAELAAKAMHTMFFEKRVKPDPHGYRHRDTVQPSWFEEYVERRMRERLRVFVGEWMRDNEQQLRETFALTMRAVMPELVAAAVFAPVDTAIRNSEDNLKTQISEYMRQQFDNAGFKL